VSRARARRERRRPAQLTQPRPAQLTQHRPAQLTQHRAAQLTQHRAAQLTQHVPPASPAQARGPRASAGRARGVGRAARHPRAQVSQKRLAAATEARSGLKSVCQTPRAGGATLIIATTRVRRRSALQLALEQPGGLAAGATRQLAKLRWSQQGLLRGQYRMGTRTEWRGGGGGGGGEVGWEGKLSAAEVVQAQSEINADGSSAEHGVDYEEFVAWLERDREPPGLHCRAAARGTLASRWKVGGLDLDGSAQRAAPLRASFGIDVAAARPVAVLSFRALADCQRELRVRNVLQAAAPTVVRRPLRPMRPMRLSCTPHAWFGLESPCVTLVRAEKVRRNDLNQGGVSASWAPLRCWEDMRQPSPYVLVVSGWEVSATQLTRRASGGGGPGSGSQASAPIGEPGVSILESVHID
jgi:hypothetical protein